MNEYKLRLIRKDEIKSKAKLMAESFADYPLYETIFDEKMTLDTLTDFYIISLFSRRNFTYVTDDDSFIGCIKRPDDRPRPLVFSLFHSLTFRSALRLLKIKNIKAMNRWEKEDEVLKKKYFDEENDTYIEAICIKKDARSMKKFLNLFYENYHDESVYCETADERLLNLYNYIGFETLGKITYKDKMTNYALKKEKKN